jgi:hypothetical protein
VRAGDALDALRLGWRGKLHEPVRPRHVHFRPQAAIGGGAIDCGFDADNRAPITGGVLVPPDIFGRQVDDGRGRVHRLDQSHVFEGDGRPADSRGGIVQTCDHGVCHHGAVEQVIITSRDPSLPPVAYLKVSGGQFRDMTIHDFDMARWLLGEEPVEIFAYGSCLVDPAVAKVNDTDSVKILMKTASGKLCHINSSRRAAYGYDQRIEVHGAKGRLLAGNQTATTVELANETAVSTDKPRTSF